MQDFFAELPGWALSLIVLTLMVIVGLTAHAVFFALAAKIARRTSRPVHELFITHSRSPARLLFPLIFIILTWSAIPPAPEIAFAGERVLGALFIVGVAWLLVKMLAVFSDWVALRYPVDVADNLKKQQAFIPSIRQGKQTAEYIDKVLTRITLGGALYVAAVCVVPSVISEYFKVPFRWGGTSIMIVVGVALDTVAQIEAHLITRNYEGLSGGGGRATRIRGRRDVA